MSRLRVLAAAAVVLALGGASASTLGAGASFRASQAAAFGCPASWSLVALRPVTGRNFVSAIDGTSSSDIWAVGFGTDPTATTSLTLTDHWDGSSWHLIPSPSPGTEHNLLYDVTARSPSDAWAVGRWNDFDTGAHGSLILHWDGSSWSVVPNPAPADSELHAITALAADDVWAAGFQYPQGRRLTLTLHWDGSQWTQVASQNPGSGNNRFWAVGAAGSDVWALGDYQPPGNDQALSERWNGSGWSVVATPAVVATLRNLSALGSSDLWAVGNDELGSSGDPLALHWDGSGWTTVPTTSLGTNIGGFNGVSARAPLDVWAAGGDRVPLLAHWDGSSWLSVPTASTGSFQDVLALASPEAVWAVGQVPSRSGGKSKPISWRACPIQVGDAGSTPALASADKGATTLWHLSRSDLGAHALSDGSGLKLFASGPLSPGSYYAFAYVAAGSYPVLEDGAVVGSVSVPLTRAPTAGTQATAFTMTWAVGALPTGDVADVQIKRPRSTKFVAWQNGTSGTQATFAPDAGTGTYQFRARLRDPGSRAVSGYSEAKSITVT